MLSDGVFIGTASGGSDGEEIGVVLSDIVGHIDDGNEDTLDNRKCFEHDEGMAVRREEV